jgi:hypothetical protein
MRSRKLVPAECALVRQALLANSLVRGRRRNNVSALVTNARRDNRIRQALGAKQVRVLSPELVISPRVAHLAERREITHCVGIASILEQAIRDNMVGVKRLPIAHHAAFLASEVVSFQHSQRYTFPGFPSVRSVIVHMLTIAQSGENCKLELIVNREEIPDDLLEYFEPIDQNARRDVWQIATQPFSGAHFATFPPALVEPCVRAGSSERGVCPVCGAPWVRVVKMTDRVATRPGNPMKNSDTRRDSETRNQRYVSTYTTVDWKPSCCCFEDAFSYETGHYTITPDPVPATILDPFCGSATTGVVAIRNGRRFVGLDLSATYLHDIAAPRLARTQPALLGVLV